MKFCMGKLFFLQNFGTGTDTPTLVPQNVFLVWASASGSFRIDTFFFDTLVITSDKGGSNCVYSRLSVCLSVSKIIKKTCVWIWMKCCVSTDVGTWTN